MRNGKALGHLESPAFCHWSDTMYGRLMLGTSASHLTYYSRAEECQWHCAMH